MTRGTGNYCLTVVRTIPSCFSAPSVPFSWQSSLELGGTFLAPFLLPELVGGVAGDGTLGVTSGTAAEDGTITIDENAAAHIFKDAPGHLADDTPANRSLLTGTANNPDNYLGTDKYGSEWYVRTEPNGTQVWVRVQNGSIRSGGVNPSPGTWIPQTGLSRP